MNYALALIIGDDHEVQDNLRSRIELLIILPVHFNHIILYDPHKCMKCNADELPRASIVFLLEI